jgi:hypothetical protein
LLTEFSVKGLVDDKAGLMVEPKRTAIAVGDFEKGALQPGLAEAVQAFQEQGTAQSAAAMLGHNSQVLDHAFAVLGTRALQGAAAAVGGFDQPGRGR